MLVLWVLGVLYLCLSLACVYSLRRGLQEVAICDSIQDTISPEWVPFMRPSSKYLPSRIKMYLRAFFIAPLSVMLFCTIFGILGLVGTVTGRSPTYLYPILGPAVTYLMGVRFEIVGQPEKVPIYVSNHIGTFDTHWIVLAHYSITALAKLEVGDMPFVGRVAKLMDCIFVDRSKTADRQAAQTAIDDYCRKYTPDKPTLLVYPEGTTSNHLQLLPFKTGAFQLTDTFYQPLRIEYPSPHYSFAIGTNQLVPWTFCFSLGGGVVRLTFLPVQRRGINETPEEAAERTRRLIATDKMPAGEYGTYRAHNDLERHVAAIRTGKQLTDTNKIE